MTKKYRLKKDISTFELQAKAGCIGIEEKQISTDSKVWFDDGRFFYRLSTILKWKDWFEEVTDTERIEVEDIYYLHDSDKTNGGGVYGFKLSAKVSKGLLPTIKEAIEKVINPETDLQKEKNAIPFTTKRRKERAK